MKNKTFYCQVEVVEPVVVAEFEVRALNEATAHRKASRLLKSKNIPEIVALDTVKFSGFKIETLHVQDS